MGKIRFRKRHGLIQLMLMTTEMAFLMPPIPNLREATHLTKVFTLILEKRLMQTYVTGSQLKR